MGKVKEFWWFLRDLFQSRDFISQLAVNDFKTKYAGSMFGIIWGFIKPIVTICVFWFVFEVGFKSMPVEDFPFILWLVCGLIPWFFFNEAWMTATNCLLEYRYLVKKVVFRVSVLPLVKIISALFIHIFFVGIIFLMFGAYGYGFKLINLQVIYYLFCTIFLLMGLAFFTSSVSVFYKDMGQFIEVLLQIGFWITPIFWNYNILQDNLLWMIKINPMFYIVEGYRDTFINHIYFFEKLDETILFWVIASTIFIIGAITFRKLREHLADVL